jgi:hypothetical protein
MCRWPLVVALAQLLAAAGVEAASSSDQQRASICPRGMVESHRWKAGDLMGFTLDLIDEAKVLQLSFGKGDVAVTAGKKGGWIAAPVFSWRIRKDGVVVLTDDGRTSWKIRKLCAGDHRVVVDLNGERQEFVVKKD